MADPAVAFDPFSAAGWTSPAANDDNAAKPTLPDAEYARIEQLASQPTDSTPSYAGTTVARAPGAVIPPAQEPAGGTFDPFAAAGWTASSALPASSPQPASSSSIVPTQEHKNLYQPLSAAVQNFVDAMKLG